MCAAFILIEYAMSDGGWSTRSKYKRLPKFVYYYDKEQTMGTGNQKYRIARKVDGKVVTFGYFANLFEARAIAEAMFYGKEIAPLPRRKAVVCNETKEVFMTIKDAAKHYNMTSDNLVKHLKGKQKTAKGLTWRYL